MRPTEELVDRFVVGDPLSSEEMARLDEARRKDPALDRELTDLLRLDGWIRPRTADAPVGPRTPMGAVHERVRSSLEDELFKPRRLRPWLAGLAAAAAVGLLGLFWSLGPEPSPGRPGPAPELRLAVEGGERSVLGRASPQQRAEPTVLAPGSRLGLVLEPERAYTLLEVTGRWRQGDQTAPLGGEWTIAPSGAARLTGPRRVLGPDWVGPVVLELTVVPADGPSVSLRRDFRFIEE